MLDIINKLNKNIEEHRRLAKLERLAKKTIRDEIRQMKENKLLRVIMNTSADVKIMEDKLKVQWQKFHSLGIK